MCQSSWAVVVCPSVHSAVAVLAVVQVSRRLCLLTLSLSHCLYSTQTHWRCWKQWILNDPTPYLCSIPLHPSSAKVAPRTGPFLSPKSVIEAVIVGSAVDLAVVLSFVMVACLEGDEQADCQALHDTFKDASQQHPRVGGGGRCIPT